MTAKADTRPPTRGVTLAGIRTAASKMVTHSVRRLGWGIVDQVVSSLTNYAATMYIVHFLGARQFGAFSLAYITYGFVLNGSRGLCTDPLMIRFSGAKIQAWRRAAADSTGTSIAWGTATGAIAFAVGMFSSGSISSVFIALGLTMPVLMLQDCWRYAFFTSGHGFQAFINDTIWAVTLLSALIVLRKLGYSDVFWFTFAWGATAGIAALAGLFQARVMPRPAHVVKWLRRHSVIAFPYLAAGLLGNVGSTVRGYGINAILGLAVVGYVQASVTLMGPMTILLLGMRLVTVAEAGRLLRRSPDKFPKFCILVSAGLSAAALLWGVALVVTVPRGLGSVLLGPIWHQAYPLIIPQVLIVLGQAAAGGARTGISALGAAKRNLMLTSLLSLIIGGCTLAGAYAGGAAGALIGMAIGTWFGTVLSWSQYRRELRDLTSLESPAAQPVSRVGHDSAD